MLRWQGLAWVLNDPPLKDSAVRDRLGTTRATVPSYNPRILYYRLMISAFTEADDGVELLRYESYFGVRPGDLPDDAQDQGKPYGILVRRMRNPLLGDSREAMWSTTRRALGGSNVPRPAVLAYKVFLDDHMQLIRNAQIGGTNEAIFKDLASETVYSRLFVHMGNMLTGMLTGRGQSAGCFFGRTRPLARRRFRQTSIW